MSNIREELDQGFLTKQKGKKHVQRERQKDDTFIEQRHQKTNLKKRLEELETYELEHDEYDGQDYSRYIR